MDPATLATAVTAFLVPFLGKVAGNIAGQAQQNLPDGVNQVWAAVLAKFKDKPAAQGSAQDLTAKADNQDNQEAFALQLKKMLKDDPAFLAELSDLLKTAQDVVGITNTGSGAVATQGGVAAGAGGIAIGGNVGGSVVFGSNNTVTESLHGRAESGDNPSTNKA